MSAIYDNWERLVAAVLKKQQLWELFHDYSRSPSILSEASDFSSSFRSSSQLDDLATDIENLGSSSGGWIESRKKTEDDIIFATRERNAYVIGLCGMGGVGKTTMAKKIKNRAKEDLADAEADLQARVDEAKSQVETWIAKAGKTRVNNTLGIGTQKPRISNLKSHYSLSMKAINTAQFMNHLRDTCNFDHISNPALPASMHHEGHPLTPPAPGGWIESRKETEDDIIITMRERNAYIIGLCGMGGVGKTTMAKQIMNRAKEDERLFGEVLLVPVGQHLDMLKIQHDIGDWLGLKLNEETLAPRAIRLRERLLGGNRKLIVIDDVWERINLEELGIPFQSDSCTVLLTSRDSLVLRQMNAQRVFTLENLSDAEAWSMFQENVGACLDDDPDLLPTARDVAKECKGLPLALVAVSRALKDQASEGIWSDALKQLQSSNPMDIPCFIEDVYNPIRLSFDFLKSPHAKSLLFLCSSFPDDHQIGLEDLALYGFGLCILGDDIDNLEDARNRITVLVDMLKSRFLILNGKDEHYVKMHDVVRDVAILVASKEDKAILNSTSRDKYPHINNCIMVSVYLTHIHPPINPHIFWWMYNPVLIFGLPSMSGDFLEGMEHLKVLSITGFSLGLTQQNIRLLKNLRTLHLYSCRLETLSAVGELSSLEILCCNNCDSITELPVEIGRLQRLRLLEVTDCSSLKTIVPGVISRLCQLEELKISGGFKGWESKEIESERSNASLAELQSLSKLTCLEIEIEDLSLDAQVLQLSSKVVKYNIQVGELSQRASLRKPTSTCTTHEKKLSVCLQMSTSLRNWIDVFARTAEYLCLEGVDSNGFDFSSNQNMRCLVLKNCQTVVKLVSSFSTDCRLGVFPVLEEIHLGSLPKFEEICDGPIPNGSNSFGKLKEISLSNLDRLLHVWRSKNQDVLLSNLCILNIWKCGKLRRVFSSSVVIRSLSQLRILEIEDCESMEEVFWIEKEEKDDGNSPSSCITFPKLEMLSLKRLGSLTYFCKEIDIIEFPQLSYLRIFNCSKLTSLGKASDHQNHVSSSGGHDSIHILCNTKISFGSLKTLVIGYQNISYLWCHHIPHLYFAELEELEVSNISNISNLFSYSIATNLVNMKTLTIERCDEMAYMIGDDSIATTAGKTPLKIFHKLERLKLSGLRSLTAFCKGIHDTNFECRLPAELIIKDCPKLTSLINILSDQNHLNYSSTPSLHFVCYTKSTFGSLHPLFCNIEVLRVEGCANINNLFSYSVAVNLVNLKKLTIKSCDEMAYVVTEDDAVETSETKTRIIIIFHKLEELKLYDLPKLQNFCEGKWDIQLPSLKKLNIENVGFYSARESVPLFCNAQITFDNLRDLHIQGYLGDRDHIKHLFSYSMALKLVNLETLYITDYKEMVYVIADGDDIAKSSGNNSQTIFHQLRWMQLERLPKLQSLCNWGWDVRFPSLEELWTYECPGMKGVTPESIRKQNMEAVRSRRQRVEVD